MTLRYVCNSVTSVSKLDWGHNYDSPHLPLSWSLSCRCVPWCLWPKHPPLHSPWCGICLCRRGRRLRENMSKMKLNLKYFCTFWPEWSRDEDDGAHVFVCFVQFGSDREKWTHMLLTTPNLLLWWVWCHQLATPRMLALSPWWQVQLVVSLLLLYWLQWLWYCIFMVTERNLMSIHKLWEWYGMWQQKTN